MIVGSLESFYLRANEKFDWINIRLCEAYAMAQRVVLGTKAASIISVTAISNESVGATHPFLNLAISK